MRRGVLLIVWILVAALAIPSFALGDGEGGEKKGKDDKSKPAAPEPGKKKDDKSKPAAPEAEKKKGDESKQKTVEPDKKKDKESKPAAPELDEEAMKKLMELMGKGEADPEKLKEMLEKLKGLQKAILEQAGDDDDEEFAPELPVPAPGPMPVGPGRRAIPMPPGGPSPEQMEEMKKRMEAAEKARKEEEIVNRYRTLLYQKPFHQWAFDKLFRIFVEKNRVKELVAEYEELSKINPEDDPYHVVLVRLYEKIDKYDQAEQALQKVQEKTHDVLLLSARIYRKQKKYTQAAEALEQAAADVQRGRVLKKIYRELGLIYTASGDRKKAKEAWAKIKTLASKNYYNIKKLAELYTAHHYYDEALAEYEALTVLARGESSRLAEICRAVGEIHERMAQTDEALKAYEKGIALMARGNWLRAELEKRVIALYRKGEKLGELEKRAKAWLEKNPQDIGSYEMLSEVYVAQKKHQKAAEILQEAVRLFKKDTELSKRLRGVLTRKKDTEGLIGEYRRIIVENPEKTDLYIELGKVFASDERFDEAKKEWDRALRKRMKGPALAVKLAILYTQYGLFTEAIAMYNRAIELAPKERSHYISLGDVYLKRGGDQAQKEAIAAWKRMTEPDPGDSAAWSDLSSVLKANAFYEQALTAIDKATGLSPENYKYLFDKAGILILRKSVDEAADLYREVATSAKEEYHRDESISQVVNLAQRGKRLRELVAKEAERKDKVSKRIRALAYERLVEYPEAAKLYRAIAGEDPKNRGVFESLARVLVRMQEYTEAQKIYERLILLNPAKAKLYYRALLDILSEMGEDEKAVEIVKRMMDSSPTNPAVCKQAGKAYMRLDRPKLALEAFQQATRLKGDDAEYWILLANTLVRLERDEEAVRALHQAVALGKENRKKFRVIGRIYDLYSRLGRLEEEIESLKGELDSNPYDANTYLFLAELLARNMEYAEAIDLVGRVLELKKDEALFREIMARLYEGMEDFAAAAEEYGKALAFPEADRKRLLEKWGRALMSAGEKEKAAEAFKQIPDTKKAVRYLMEHKLYDEAAQVLGEALRNEPLKDKYHALMADVFQAKGQKEEAIEKLKEALEIKPAQKEYLSSLADLYFTLGDKKNATLYAGKLFGAALREKEEEEEEDEDDYYSYYRSYYWGYYYGSGTTGLEAVQEAFYFFIRRGMLDEFRSFVEEELKRQPNNVLLRILGVRQMLNVTGYEELALRVLRELLRMEIDQKKLPMRYLVMGDVKDGLRFSLARLYSDKPTLRSKEMARQEKERKAGTKDAQLLLELAIIYDIEKKKEQSLAALAEAEKLAPDVPIVVLAKARMHEARSEWDDAKNCYEKFLTILEGRENLRKRRRSFFRMTVKNEIPAELRASVTTEMIEYLTDRAMARSMGGYYGEYGSQLPDKHDVSLALARVEKAAGNMEGAKKYLAKMEPAGEKSPDSASKAAFAYKEFELLDDAARMYELELAQRRYRKRVLGNLDVSRYFGGYGPSWGWGQDAVSELVEHYRKKERYLEALDISIEFERDIKTLLAEHKLFEPGKKMYRERLEALSRKPEGERDPAEYRETIVRLAKLLNEEKKYDDMEPLYNSYLEKFPDDIEFLVPRAIFLENNEKFAEAAEVLKRAAKLAEAKEKERKRRPRIEPIRPTPPKPPLKESQDSYYDRWGWRSRFYGSSYQGVSAGACIMGVARLYAKMGNKKEAVKAMKKYYVESRKTSSWGSSDSLERFIERFGLEDEMASVYRTVMILYPDDTETRLAYGKYLEKKERFEEALKLYEKTMRMFRSGYGWYYGEERVAERLERLYRKLKKKVISFEEIRDAALKSPKNVKANTRLTAYYFINGQIREAAEQAEKTLKIAPYLTVLQRLLFYAYRILDDEKKALGHLETEIKLTRDDGSKRKLYTSYGGMLYFSGDQEKAIETWKKMAVSDDSSANRYLGDLFVSLGMYKLGASYLEKAAKAEVAMSRWYGSDITFRAIAARMLAGDFDKGAKAVMDFLEKRLASSYELSEGIMSITAVSERLGKLEELEGMIWKKAEENADKIEWWHLLLAYCEKKGYKDKVRDICHRIVKLRPDETGPLRRLESFAFEDEDLMRAYELNEKIYEVAKKEAGSAFTGGGRRADYLKELEKEYHRGRATVFSALEDVFKEFSSKMGKKKKRKRSIEEHEKTCTHLGAEVEKDKLSQWCKEKVISELRQTLEEDKPETIMALARSFSGYDYDTEALETVEEYLGQAKAKSCGDYQFYGSLLLEAAIRREAAGVRPEGKPLKSQVSSLKSQAFFKKAVEAYEKAADMAQGYWSRSESFQSIFRIHKRLGTIPSYIEKMKKYVKEHPEEREMQQLVFNALSEIEDNEGAIEYARHFLKEEPARVEYVTRLANYLTTEKKHAQAVELLKKALEKNPPAPARIYHMLAECFFEMKDKKSAFEWLGKATEHEEDPKMSYVRALLGKECTKEAFEILHPMWEERVEDTNYNLTVAGTAYELASQDSGTAGQSPLAPDGDSGQDTGTAGQSPLAPDGDSEPAADPGALTPEALYKIALEAIERAFLFEEWGGLDDLMKANLRALYAKTGVGEKIVAEAGSGTATLEKVPAAPDDLVARKRLFLYHLAANDRKAVLRTGERILEKEPFNLNFLQAALAFAHNLGEKDKALALAIRLSKVVENGGSMINKEYMKKFLISLARSENPLSAVAGEHLFYSRDSGLSEYIGNIFFKKGETDDALSWWKRILYSSQDSYYFYGESNTRELARIYIEHELFDPAREILKSSDLFRSYYYYSYSDSGKALEARILRKEGKGKEAVDAYLTLLEEKYEDSWYGYYDPYGYYSDDEMIREFVNLLRDEGRIDEFYEIAKEKVKEGTVGQSSLAPDEEPNPLYCRLLWSLIYEKRDKGAVEGYLKLKYEDDLEGEEALEAFARCYRDAKNYVRLYEISKKILEKVPVNREPVLFDLFIATAKLGKQEEKEKYEKEYLSWNTVKEDSRWLSVFQRTISEELYSDAYRYAGKLLEKEAQEKKKREEEKKKKEKKAEEGEDDEEEEEEWGFSVRNHSSLKEMYEKLGMEEKKAEFEAKEKGRTGKYLKGQIEALEKNPHNPAPHRSLYWHYLGKDEWDKALESLEKYRELSGSSSFYDEQLGWYWFKRGKDGDYAKALESLIKAREQQKIYEELPDTRGSYASWPSRGYYWGWGYGYGYGYGRRSYYPRPSRYYGRSWRYGSYYYRRTDFSYSHSLSLDYGIAISYYATGDKEKAKEHFRKARSDNPDSVFRLFADCVLDGKAIDWELVKEVTGEDYKYYERFKLEYEKK